jgi:predicted RNase H-like HicB family nuclease
MKKYLIVVEKTGTGYSAYSPDLDGCIATGKTREEVERECRRQLLSIWKACHAVVSRSLNHKPILAT